MKNLSDLEKKINSELATKVKTTKIKIKNLWRNNLRTTTSNKNKTNSKTVRN